MEKHGNYIEIYRIINFQCKIYKKHNGNKYRNVLKFYGNSWKNMENIWKLIGNSMKLMENN